MHAEHALRCHAKLSNAAQFPKEHDLLLGATKRQLHLGADFREPYLHVQAASHAGDESEKMIKGDPGIEDIYYWGPEGPRVSTRGRTGPWAFHAMLTDLHTPPIGRSQVFQHSHDTIL